MIKSSRVIKIQQDLRPRRESTPDGHTNTLRPLKLSIARLGTEEAG